MRPVVTWVYTLLLLSMGVVLGAGGARLVILNGSWYYLGSGLALIVCALMLPVRPAAAARIYAATFVATVAWAFWEVGADGWALFPRVVAPALLGFGFVALRDDRLHAVMRCLGWAALGAAAGSALHYSLYVSEPDPVYRTGRIAQSAVSLPGGNTLNSASADTGEAGDWPYVGHDAGGSRFSPQGGITAQNVSGLRLQWTYHSGLTDDPLEATPLKIGRLLYLCTGANDVIALDAESGVERWRFRSGAGSAAAVFKTCRGVAYYRVPGLAGECAERVFTNTVDARLIALDALSGARCAHFGANGEISLLVGMGDWRGRIIPGYYYVTSAPTVVRGRVVLGGWVSDAQYWGEPSGVIRAFDALTGAFSWAFDMGRPQRHSEPEAGRQFTPSTPNSWAPMSADEALGLVYAPTGNTSGSDYYGGLRRPFDERYSSSVLALDATTGEVRWSFQTVHHDLWDYDVAAQPVLTDFPTAAGVVPALIQATKTGEIFVLDRRDGRPVLPVREVPAPQRGAVAGESLAPTQPVSAAMPSFGGPALEERAMWGLTPIDQMLCRIRFRQARYAGPFTPPGPAPFIEYPGILGGIEWGSVSVHPGRAVVIVNASRLANYVTLIPRARADAEARRPQGFGGQYLQRAQAGTPFAVANPPFVSRLGIPCQNPPYGTLSAVSLTTGRLMWTRPLGTARGSGPFGWPSQLPFDLGTPNLGGTLTTRTGLVFVAGGQDRHVRAYGLDDGRLLWQQRLPAVSVATPMTYRSEVSSRQFVVVVAGNTDPRLGATGAAVLAYALPH